MVNAVGKGDYQRARELHFELLELIEALFEDGNPGGLKAALDVLGLAGNNLRLPLVKVNKATYNTIANLTNALK